MIDHLSKAKNYIAKGEDYYRRAADEIIAAREEDPTLGWPAVAERVGMSRTWCQQLVQWRTTRQATGSPFARDEGETERKDRAAAKTVLAEAEQRRKVMADLEPAELEKVIEDANDVAFERTQARREEHQADGRTTPASAGIGDWDPGESWADTLVIRVARNARELSDHVKRWGLVVNALTDEETLAYLDTAERQIAEIRAAAQERVREAVTTC